MLRSRLTPEETRARIVEVAEEHFRRVGYAKTAVADIAAALGMSPANVYRFFDSKSAINNAICDKLMAECHHVALASVSPSAAPSVRLRQLILSLHRFHKSRMTDEHRLHDMVAVAMQENWPAIEKHKAHMAGLLLDIMRDGVKQGEFVIENIEEMATTSLETFVCVLHPGLIAQFAHQDLEAKANRLVDFTLLALRR